MPKRSLENAGKRERANAAKAANARERNIAKHYLSSGPNIINLARAAYHWYNSVPWLGGQNENGLIIIKGDVPTPGMRSPKAIAKSIKTITKINASKITPAQWTAAQDAAIARGDISEAQRLRDLHFKVSAPNTQIKDIQYHGAKGNAKFNVFNPKLIGQTDQGWAGRGYYFTPIKDYAKMYGSEPRAFYINAKKVHDGTASTYFGREDSTAAEAFKRIRKKLGVDVQPILDDLISSDAIRTSFQQTKPYNGTFEEVVTRNNNQMKLADAVTYDGKGIRIPLGERDNFNSNDIRYALTPFIVGGTGYGIYNRAKKRNGGSNNIGSYKRSIEDAGRISDEEYYNIMEAERSVPYDWQRNKKANGGEIKYNTTSGGGYIQPINVEKFKNYIKSKIYNYVTGKLPINVVRNRMYNNLFQGYDPGISNVYNNVKRVRKAVVNNEKEKTIGDETIRQRIMDDLFAEYLQIPKNKRRNISKNYLTDSPYKPNINKNNINYKRIKHRYVSGHSGLHPDDEERLVNAVMKGEYTNNIDAYSANKNLQSTSVNHPPVSLNKTAISEVLSNYGLGTHTISRGKDNKGEYVSYYDLWDMAPTSKSAGNKDESMGIGKPIHIYDRLYLDDFYGVPNEYSGGYYIPEVIVKGNRKKHVNK